MTISPIGIFDSGLGGLSVLAEARRFLPNESFIYLADGKNVPYGTKSKQEIKDISEKNTDFLISKGAKAILVACNTATSVAIEDLREKHKIPILGMEPAVKPALEINSGKRVLILATPITSRGEKLNLLLEKIDVDDSCIVLPSGDLAGMIEKHLVENHKEFVYSQEIEDHLKKVFLGIDLGAVSAIVLGCTHYSFLKPYLEKMISESTTIVDGNEGTARNLLRILREKGLLNEEGGKPKIDFYSTDESVNIEEICEGVLEGYLTNIREY